MAKNSEIYYLVKINNITNEVEYFDFDLMDFSCDVGRPAPLSSIDALTSLFEDGQELDNYTSKKANREKEYNYSFKIIGRTARKKEIKTIEPVWDDLTLNSISKVCSDGKVDFSNDKNYNLFHTIMDMVLRTETGLAVRIIKSKDEGLRLNNQNKILIGALASSNKNFFKSEMEKIFSNYREFRALYMNYKEYNVRQKSFGEYLKKLNLKF